MRGIRAAVLLMMLACAGGCRRHEAASETTMESRAPDARTDDWAARLRSPADRDPAIRGFLASDLPRGDKIRTLVALLAELAGGERLLMLDVLASLQPIEAAGELCGMLENTRDPELAARLISTLRAATRITSSENRVDWDDERLSRAFERVQAALRAELGVAAREPERFRAALAAVSDVFPADEANAIFAELAADDAAPLEKSELFGLWLELLVGAVDGRDFQRISEFVRDHPQALADERVKARVLQQLAVTPVRADELDALAPLLDQLAPAPAPDDSFVRWLAVKAQLTGVPPDAAALLRSASPLHKAALVHFGGLAEPLDAGSARELRRELTEAAAVLPESETRDFLEEAAAAISLGVRETGP